MQNPFESGQIKNYLLFYASVLVIIVLFFIASTLFNDIHQVKEKKEFNTEKEEKLKPKKEQENSHPLKFKLLQSAY